MRILYLGSGQIALRCLQAILLRGDRHTLCGIVGPESLRDALDDQDDVIYLELNFSSRQERRLLEIIREVCPDVVLSVQYPWILSSDVIDALNGRVINLHNAKLPDYRGHHSISHALLNGESTYTSTLHWIAPEVDRGRCIDTETIGIQPGDTAYSLWSKTIHSCVALVERLLDGARVVESIADGVVIGNGGKFYSNKLLDSLKRVSTDASIDRIDLVARACHFPPHEPAYLEVNGRKTYLLAGTYRYLASAPMSIVPPQSASGSQ